MSNHCQDPLTCPNGNCSGCDDGMIWCQDPKCAPYCSGCVMPSDHDQMAGLVIGVIIVCLIIILFIVWFVFGPRLIHEHSVDTYASVLS